MWNVPLVSSDHTPGLLRLRCVALAYGTWLTVQLIDVGVQMMPYAFGPAAFPAAGRHPCPDGSRQSRKLRLREGFSRGRRHAPRA